jgi:hypothetical protein
MGKINVKGLGVVEIQGDTPTSKEATDIKKALTTLNVEGVGNSLGDLEAQQYADGPNFGRILTEVGGSIIGSIATGGFTLPGIVRNVGMRSMPFLRALAKASAGSAAGGGTGAVVAQTFDPKEDIVKEVVRAAGEGALGEAVGAPLAIKAAPIITKILGRPKQFARELEGAKLAEQQLKTKSYEILYGKSASETLKNLSIENQLKYISEMAPKIDIDKNIREYMKKTNLTEDKFEVLKDAALESQKGLTPAYKTNNQGINILETIMSKSILGGGQFARRYRAISDIGDRIAYDTVNEMAEGNLAANKSELGGLFLTSFNDGARLFKTASDAMFEKVDKLLKGGRDQSLSIFERLGTKNSLSETVAEINENITRGIDGGINDPNFKIMSGLSRDLGKITEDFGGKFSYVEIAAKRSNLAAHKEMLKASGQKESIEAVTKVIQKMDDMLSPQMLRTAGLDPKAADALQEARDFYKAGKDVFQRGTVSALLAKGARETADLGTVFKRITDGNQIDLLGRVLRDIDALPTVTKNQAFKDAIGKPITQADVKVLKESLRGHFLENMLAKSLKNSPQFGSYYKAESFIKALDNNMDTLKLLYPDPADVKKLRDLQTSLGFSQGKISDISGIPGGVLIQLKQAGAAGQLLQFGGGIFSPGVAPIGVGLATGSILPALGVVIAPKYIGKVMLDPKFQELAFKSSVKPLIEKANTPKRMQSVYNQMLGRLVTLGAIPEAEAAEVKDGIQSYLDAIEEQKSQRAVPLPDVQPANFPVINQGGSTVSPTGGSSPELAQALNLFNKGGIVSAKKNF